MHLSLPLCLSLFLSLKGSARSAMLAVSVCPSLRSRWSIGFSWSVKVSKSCVLYLGERVCYRCAVQIDWANCSVFAARFIIHCGKMESWDRKQHECMHVYISTPDVILTDLNAFWCMLVCRSFDFVCLLCVRLRACVCMCLFMGD